MNFPETFEVSVADENGEEHDLVVEAIYYEGSSGDYFSPDEPPGWELHSVKGVPSGVEIDDEDIIFAVQRQSYSCAQESKSAWDDIRFMESRGE